MHQLGSLR